MDPNPYATPASGMQSEEPVRFGPPPWPEQGGIPFEGTLRFEDFLQAQRLHEGLRGGMVFPVLLILIALLGFAISFLSAHGRVPAWGFLAVPIGVIALVVLRRMRFKRMWSASKLNGQPVMGHIGDVGVELRLPILEARLTWGAYLRFKVDDELLLIYQQPAMFNLFPRRFFRDEADWKACRALVEQHLPR